jgi:hypothetical protein
MLRESKSVLSLEASVRDLLSGTVTFAAVPVTGRLAAISARHIISDIGSYYAVVLIGLTTLQIADV